MVKDLLQLLNRYSFLQWHEVALNIVMAAIIGGFVFLAYYISYRSTIYSKKFNTSLVIIAALSATAVTLIADNLGLGLGAIALLSIVRFRSGTLDFQDSIYIFWAIVVGIACGIGEYMTAAIGSVAAFLILLVLGRIKGDNRMLLIIRSPRVNQSIIQAAVYQFFEGKANLRVRNTSDKDAEFIFEISERVLHKMQNEKGDITDTLYRLGEIEYINIILQNEEVSN